MDFKTLARTATLLAKPFADEFMRLLVVYKSISASEAASRLDLHIKTAQDFLEQWHLLGYLSKQEVFERKRPYYRYSLKNTKITLQFDWKNLHTTENNSNRLNQKIREKINSAANFTIAGNNTYISAVTVFIGEGRQRKERKLNLTNAQGKFLYHLPFPTAKAESIAQILNSANLKSKYIEEIYDMILLLNKFDVIEFAGE